MWLDISPQTGREQSGWRPALVVSPSAYNAKVGLALFCPITSKEKGFPFEVRLPVGGKVSGVVLTDQLKSLAWCVRAARFAEYAPAEVTSEVLAKVLGLVQ